ncbi:MAG TPA: endonuclease III domain-containing protein [Ruminiclostridium sp.]|nr:endonuclease III domain-containing protein [Ruminiclostridium sp.]
MITLTEVFDRLHAVYGKRHWWPAGTPFEMMVGAILTQNTTWTNVEKAIENIGEKLSPEFIREVSCEELAGLIRCSGYYNQKAIKLKALTAWFEKYGFDIRKAMAEDGEALRAELLNVKGVGRETADSILTYALEKPFFVVDAYTRRLLYRLGFDIPTEYDDIRRFIEAGVPRELYIYNEFHALIVCHAKESCKKAPKCDGCPIEDICSKHMG